MQLTTIETPGLAHYSYLIIEGDEAAVVDPRRDVEEYLAIARRAGARIRYVLETHRQEDFVMGSACLAKLASAQIVNGDHKFFGHGDIRLEDEAEVTLGGLTFRALHTPGHTPESVCYAVYTTNNSKQPWCLFSGDTLLFGTTGRTDLADEGSPVDNAGQLYDSIHSKLSGLGDDTLVLPAHGAGSVCGSGVAARPISTLGQEKEYSDVFTLERDAFAETKGAERQPRPPYFRHMEKVNLQGGMAPSFQPGVVPLLDAATFAEVAGEGLLYDTREPEGFAGGHIERSFSIWLSGLPAFGGWIAGEDSPIYLITDREEDVDTAAIHLSRIGIDNIRGGLKGGFPGWRRSGLPIHRSGTVTPRELAADLGAYQVLDVRETGEYDSGHIPGATHLFVGDLPGRVDELDFRKDRPVVVTCGVGHRAGLGVSILLNAGFGDVRNLLGGMSAWQVLKFETEQ